MALGKRIVPPVLLAVVVAALVVWHVLGAGNPQLDGDMHVHTTLSVDAFQQSLPLLGGEGIHPPADACDFARFCSQLDFYALTDHAEALTPRTWQMVKDSVRQCNAVGERSTPDLVAFTGYEWSQVGLTPETHLGHKNVIYKHTDEDRLPARQIGAPGLVDRNFRNWRTLLVNIQLPFFAYFDQQPYNDVIYHVREGMSVSECPRCVPSPLLPADCREVAETPRDLFRKLDEWGHEALVIPHGTTRGFYTLREYLWDKQLAAEQDDPKRSSPAAGAPARSSEAAVMVRARRSAKRTCRPPEPTTCMRAPPGTQPCPVRSSPSGATAVSARTASALHFSAGRGARFSTCSREAIFGEAEKPRHVTFGFMGSSDNRAARPGTGYKEFARHRMTEARGDISEEWQRRTFGFPEKTQTSVKLSAEDIAAMPPFRTIWVERQASFFMTGGLVAVHAPERTREAIWDSLVRREVYGTSGDRILLWFDLLNAGDAPVPMGSDLSLASTPKFRVKAAGSFEQKPGCPDSVVEALGPERVENVCAGECYYPSDERRAISRIEVVRIARQMQDSEPIDDLIDDPWLTLPCPRGAAVCEVEFEDPAFLESSRELLYYVRAVQEPTRASERLSRHLAQRRCARREPHVSQYALASRAGGNQPSARRLPGVLRAGRHRVEQHSLDAARRPPAARHSTLWKAARVDRPARAAVRSRSDRARPESGSVLEGFPGLHAVPVGSAFLRDRESDGSRVGCPDITRVPRREAASLRLRS